jgi:hypothetical protein
MVIAPVTTNPIGDKWTPSTNKHCFQMYFGPCSTKNKETPQQRKRRQHGNGFGNRQAYKCTTLKLGQTIKVADKASTGQA